jgi:hypothetical protein
LSRARSAVTSGASSCCAAANNSQASRGQLLLPLTVSLLIGCKALQLHAPLAAEEALGDLGPTPLL